jgi:hypothetical protein
MQGNTSGLIGWIAGAALAAFALDYCTQPFAAGLNPPGHIGLQGETVQPMNVVNRVLKGDRLRSDQLTSDRAASGAATVDESERQPMRAAPREVPHSQGLQPKLPEGCEPALSPLVNSKQNNFPAGCLT